MIKKNQFILILIIFVAVVLVPLLWFGASRIQRAGKTEVTLEYAPKEAKVTVDGQKVSGNTIYLEPGEHTFKASHEGYADDAKKVTIGKQKSTVLLLPQPSQSTIDKLADDNETQMQREAIGGRLADEEGQKLYEKNPIIDRLPHPYGQQEFAIDYEESSRSKTGVVILIEGETPKSREYALAQIREWGFDPSELTIEFTGFKNPLGSEVYPQ